MLVHPAASCMYRRRLEPTPGVSPMRGTVLATTAIAVLILGVPAHADTTPDPVVAVVNGTQIHKSDIDAAYATLPEQYRQMPLQQIYDPLLDQVISSQLLLVQAKKL